VSEAPPFRRSRFVPFNCPHCGRQSSTCLVGARYNLSPRSFTTLYKCEQCGGLAKLSRPTIVWLVQIAVAILLFAGSYSLLLNFAAQWHILLPSLLSLGALSLLVSRATFRLTATYVPLELEAAP